MDDHGAGEHAKKKRARQQDDADRAKSVEEVSHHVTHYQRSPSTERSLPIPRADGTDQSRLVGHDHSLHAIPKPQLAEYMRDMGLDRGLADMQPSSDLSIRKPAGKFAQDLELALGEGCQLLRPLDCRLGAPGELLDQAPGHGGIEQRV